jgi:transcriptional regulator with XRE-family HTH domain
MKTSNSANSAKKFGRYVRSLRLKLGLSRAELAQRLGLILGSHVSHVERGEARISPGALADWARALEIDPVMLKQAQAECDAAQAAPRVERSGLANISLV